MYKKVITPGSYDERVNVDGLLCVIPYGIIIIREYYGTRKHERRGSTAIIGYVEPKRPNVIVK